MEEWIDSYMENVYPTRRINERFKYATETEARQTSASSSAASLLHPLASRATYFEHAPNQPHPECIEPPPKKQKRFQTLSCEELDKLSTPYIPKNTESSTKWAVENFNSWLSHRNLSAKSEADKCPVTLLEDMDSTQLNKWLAVYMAETRKVNGDAYPPATLQSLLSGLQRHMCSVNATQAPNIFDKSNPVFKELHSTMDSVYRKLRSNGVGAEKQSAEPFTKEEENKLWEQGIDNGKWLPQSITTSSLLL